MINPTNTATCLKWAFVAIAIALIVGCRKSDSDVRKPNGEKPPAAAKPPPSIWTPNPIWANRLTQPGSLGKYKISLPAEFTFLGSRPGLPDTIKSFAWKGQPGAGNHPPFLMVTIHSDTKTVEEAKTNMRQLLVNFSAGVTDSMGVGIAKRERTESGLRDGIAFFRFKWSGSTKNQVQANGLACGAIDEASVILINAINFGANAETENQLMESVIATFKKH